MTIRLICNHWADRLNITAGTTISSHLPLWPTNQLLCSQRPNFSGHFCILADYFHTISSAPYFLLLHPTMLLQFIPISLLILSQPWKKELICKHSSLPCQQMAIIPNRAKYGQIQCHSSVFISSVSHAHQNRTRTKLQYKKEGVLASSRNLKTVIPGNSEWVNRVMSKANMIVEGTRERQSNSGSPERTLSQGWHFANSSLSVPGTACSGAVSWQR